MAKRPTPEVAFLLQLLSTVQSMHALASPRVASPRRRRRRQHQRPKGVQCSDGRGDKQARHVKHDHVVEVNLVDNASEQTEWLQDKSSPLFDTPPFLVLRLLLVMHSVSLSDPLYQRLDEEQKEQRKTPSFISFFAHPLEIKYSRTSAYDTAFPLIAMWRWWSVFLRECVYPRGGKGRKLKIQPLFICSAPQ